MTKKKIYFPCQIENYDIPEIFKKLLTIQCQKLLITINKKEDAEAALYYNTISDIHHFCNIQYNSNHKIPFPQSNLKYWRTRGEITKYIYLLLLEIRSLETVCWTPTNELTAILEERFIFFEHHSTVTETTRHNRSTIQKLKSFSNPYSELLPHTYEFIKLCIKYAVMANKASFKTNTWNPFLINKLKLLPLIRNNYFPIYEGVVRKNGVDYSNVNLIFDKSCVQFCTDINGIAAFANPLSKYTQGC